MRLLSRFGNTSIALLVAVSWLMAGRPATSRAADLDQLLRTVAENAESHADADKTDKSDKPAEATTNKTKEEGSGAKKDEDTAAKSAAKRKPSKAAPRAGRRTNDAVGAG